MNTPANKNDLHTLFDYSTSFYYVIVDVSGKLEYSNPYFRNQFGKKETGYIDKKLAVFFPDHQAGELYNTFQYCRDNPGIAKHLDLVILANTENRHISRWEFTAITDDNDGTVDIHGVGYALEKKEPIVSNGAHQLVEKMTVEDELLKSELFYRNLFADSLDGVLITNEKGLVYFASASIISILGYRIDELIGTSAFDHVHPDDRELAITTFMDEVKQEPMHKFISIRLKKQNGEWLYCIIRGHNLMHNPYVNGMVIYFYDDTLRKETEAALQQSEKRFRDLIQNLGIGVVVQNEKGIVNISNKAAQVILGLPEDKIIGSHSSENRWEVINEEGHSFPREEHPAARVFTTGKPVRDVVMGVIRPLLGDRVWLLVNADPSFDQSGKIQSVVVSFLDITEQKRLSRELVEQEINKQKLLTQATIDGQEKERLEMGKELHDNIKQNLNTTRLYLEVAREKASGPVKEMIEFSHRSLAGIIDKIRALSQSLVPPTLGDIGLVESIQDICDSLKRTHKFKIHFFHRHFIEEGVPENMRLMLFRITQEQVNNIIRHSDAIIIQIKLESDAEYINLSIADNGKGFDPANIKKGLGFTNIMNRASLFNGLVEIEAAKGKGCRLSVNIPLKPSHEE